MHTLSRSHLFRKILKSMYVVGMGNLRESLLTQFLSTVTKHFLEPRIAMQDLPLAIDERNAHSGPLEDGVQPALLLLERLLCLNFFRDIASIKDNRARRILRKIAPPKFQHTP